MKANLFMKKTYILNVTSAVLIGMITMATSCEKKPVPRQPIDIEMVFVEGGTFLMGGDKTIDSLCYDNESPVHNVTLSSFYIGKYEITQAQWVAMMDENPSEHFGDSLRPVESMSANYAEEFTRRLSAATGINYRLPTEAEWEYAARGGNSSQGYKYAGSNDANEIAWYVFNSGDSTHPVGSKLPNELGIYDMSGNVWEWCSDRYGTYPSTDQTNPTGATWGASLVIRGGAYDNKLFYGWLDEELRVTMRGKLPMGTFQATVGMRVAYSAK
ncbi:hypothetical protein FACS1894201_05480 [Bacteroidia bacterium]|nr:hypothetical protein FACS1894201_05480 [Bacteroidia bacterium]